MKDMQHRIQQEIEALSKTTAAQRTDAQLALIEDRTNDPVWTAKVHESMAKRDQQWRNNVQQALQRRHKDPAYREKLKNSISQMWQRAEVRSAHRQAVRQHHALSPELICKIFQEYHNPQRSLDDKTYKSVLCKTYGISAGHMNKICAARSVYIRECLNLSQDQIQDLQAQYEQRQSIYQICTFGTDVMDLYRDYTYRSKFPLPLVWQVRFGKYRGLTRTQLEQTLDMKLTTDDMTSLKMCYNWLTDQPSKEIYRGNYAGATKFVKVLPTKQQRFGFIKTGPYQGCHIIIE